MSLRDIIDRQAGAVEYVLHTHGIRASVDGGRLSPRLAHFHLALPEGFNPSRLAPLVPELADALGVVSCRLTQGEGGVYLEAPRPDPIPVRLLPLVQRVADVVPPVTAGLGLDTEGTPLLLRLNSPDVDPVMVVGSHDAGKSSLMRGMALSLALHNSPDRLRLLLLDCESGGMGFRGLENLPHLACPVARGPVEAVASLRWAMRALARRAHTEDADELFFDDDDIEPQPYAPTQGDEDRPALVVMVDGIGALCRAPNGQPNTEVVKMLRRLLLSGSAHGVHIVVSGKQPDELMNVNTTWGARITGRVDSSEDARLATGAKGSGAHNLLGSGDFLISLNAELIRFQAAVVSEQELVKAVQLILTWSAPAPRQPVVEEAAPLMPRALAEPYTLQREWYGE